MKQTYAVQVKGKHHNWSFTFKGNPEHLKDWQEDGLEVYEIVNTIPETVVNLGFLKPWVFIQDFWKLLKLW